MNISTIIKKIGDIALATVTSQDERVQIEKILSNLELHKAELQTDIAKMELKHSNFFITGARYSVFWVCSAGLLFHLIISPLMRTAGLHVPPVDIDNLVSMVSLIFVNSGYRTIEKIKGVARDHF